MAGQLWPIPEISERESIRGESIMTEYDSSNLYRSLEQGKKMENPSERGHNTQDNALQVTERRSENFMRPQPS